MKFVAYRVVAFITFFHILLDLLFIKVRVYMVVRFVSFCFIFFKLRILIVIYTYCYVYVFLLLCIFCSM